MQVCTEIHKYYVLSHSENCEALALSPLQRKLFLIIIRCLHFGYFPTPHKSTNGTDMKPLKCSEQSQGRDKPE